MRRVAWLTDIHLNFLTVSARELFYDRLRAAQYDAVLCGGDVSEGPDLPRHLRELAAAVGGPVYFVLGNHDFYFSSIAGVRKSVAALCLDEPRLVWLSESDAIELAPGVGLVGHDGWADGHLGDYERSLVRMNDHRLIGEFVGLDKRARFDVLRELGAQAGVHIERVLAVAAARYPQVMLVTHAPPFRGACWHEGAISDDHWLPHFTCHAVGEAIVRVMMRFPQTRLTVLCGHTHSPGELLVAANVQVLTGGAEYGAPVVQRMWEI